MDDILPSGSVRNEAGCLTLEWLAVYKQCEDLLSFSEDWCGDGSHLLRAHFL